MKAWQQLNQFERIWVSVFVAITVATTVIFSVQGTDYASPISVLLNWVISPLAAISGLVCVVLAAKGKIGTYYWGIPNAILYGIIAIVGGIWGDVFSNLIYFLPLQFIGIVTWRRRMADHGTVKMSGLGRSKWFAVAGAAIAAVLLFALVLSAFDNWFTNLFRDNQAFYGQLAAMFGLQTNFLGAVLDASTEIFQILAGILMVLALKEQWIFWIATNVVSIFTWSVILISDPTAASWVVPIIVMWVGFGVNSIYGYVNWSKGAANQTVPVPEVNFNAAI